MLLDTLSNNMLLSIISISTLVSSANAVTNWPPALTSEFLGYTSDKSFNAALYRDGGGGGMTGNYLLELYGAHHCTLC